MKYSGNYLEIFSIIKSLGGAYTVAGAFARTEE